MHLFTHECLLSSLIPPSGGIFESRELRGGLQVMLEPRRFLTVMVNHDVPG